MAESCRTHKTQAKDLGYPFQFEIFYHMILKLEQMNCTQYEVGYEVHDVSEAEDVTCDFTFQGEKFFFSIQCKSGIGTNKDKEVNVTKDRFFNPNTDLYVKDYLDALRKRQSETNPDSKFILILTAKLQPKMKKTDITDSGEDAIMFQLLKTLKLKGAEVQRFSEDSNNAGDPQSIHTILEKEKKKSSDRIKRRREKISERIKTIENYYKKIETYLKGNEVIFEKSLKDFQVIRQYTKTVEEYLNNDEEFKNIEKAIKKFIENIAELERGIEAVEENEENLDKISNIFAKLRAEYKLILEDFEENEEANNILKDFEKNQENFVIVSKCPKYYDLRKINDELAVEIAEENRSPAFPALLREKLKDHTEHSKESGETIRKFCTDNDFLHIFKNSFLDTNLPFFVNWTKIRGNKKYLQYGSNENEIRSGKNKYPYSKDRTYFKIYKTVLKLNHYAVLVCLSDLSPFARDALKYCDSKIVVFDDGNDCLRDKEYSQNVIYVYKENNSEE